MGKGDKKTKRGKITQGSYGKTRPRKASKPATTVEKPAKVKEEKAEPKPKATPKAKAEKPEETAEEKPKATKKKKTEE